MTLRWLCSDNEATRKMFRAGSSISTIGFLVYAVCGSMAYEVIHEMEGIQASVDAYVGRVTLIVVGFAIFYYWASVTKKYQRR